jgi:hypothetical protein
MDLFELLDDMEAKLIEDRDNCDPDTCSHRVLNGQDCDNPRDPQCNGKRERIMPRQSEIYFFALSAYRIGSMQDRDCRGQR